MPSQEEGRVMNSLNLPGTMDREFGGGGARQNVQNLRYRERATSQDFSKRIYGGVTKRDLATKYAFFT